MKYRKVLYVAMAAALVLSTACQSPSGPRREVLYGVKNVLILGDSISMGYTPFVAANLATLGVRAIHTADNNRNTVYTLANIDYWLNQYVLYGPFQIITWNNGVWDSVTKGQETSADDWFGQTPEKYELNLRLIATKLQSTGARVIFFTTTVIPGGPFDIGKELVLNEIAKRVLPSMGIEVYDLNAVSLTQSENRKDGPWDVHYNNIGCKVLGDYVTRAILKQEGEIK